MKGIDETGRFVIQEHKTGAGIHWDLMLEAGEVLATWSLEALPSREQSVRGERIQDHRRRYLTYEGPISGGRGEVCIRDLGFYGIVEKERSGWVLELNGMEIAGIFRLYQARPGDWVLEGIGTY